MFFIYNGIFTKFVIGHFQIHTFNILKSNNDQKMFETYKIMTIYIFRSYVFKINLHG